MSYTPGSAAWKIAFELSPIILTNGLFNAFPGRMMPVIAVTEALNLPLGALGGGSLSLDKAFAHFMTLSGTSLVDQDIARVPFANQAVAANAVIRLPLQVSLVMLCPVQTPFGMFSRLPIMMALTEVFNQHNNAGGTYIVATPSRIYTNCVMRSMRDVSTQMTKQPQNAWQIDFEQPLITLEDAEQAENGLFGMLTAGLPVSGNPPLPSGLATAGSIPSPLTGLSVVPTMQGAVGAGTSAASALAAGLIPV